MLKSAGAVDHAFFDTITHLSHRECHLVSLPPFFGVLELAKSLSSLMQQVAVLIVLETVGEEVFCLLCPFFLGILC
jgi:hypothetical protein